MDRPRPKSKMAVWKAVAPFEIATLLAWVTVLVGTSVDWPQYVAASVIVVLVGTLPLTGWRQVSFGSIPSAFLYLLAVALLRDSAGGISSGVGMISLVPVFYVALYGTRRAIYATLAGVAVFYLAPILLVGPPEYPHSQYRVAVLSVAVSAIIGLTTQALVRRVRRSAAEARERERMLSQVNDLVRGLFASSEARSDVCEAARTIGAASVAILYEPVGEGSTMRSTAIAGIDSAPAGTRAEGSSAVTEAFATGKAVLITEGVDERVGSHALWEAAGRPSSVLYEPLLRGTEVVGVLAVGWHAGVVASGPRVTVVSLLAHEAAAVIDRADMVSQLTAIAETDPLTGLPNRRAWDARMRAAIEERKGFTVAILDLDHFKVYNDTHGHPAGDRLLKETGAAWRSQLRVGDFLARIGGEEFALLLVDADDSRAREATDRLRTHVTGGQTCSVGFASRARGESARQVMARADAALYEAKSDGRNRVRSAR